MTRSLRLAGLFVIAALLLAGCAAPSWLPGFLRPYRPDVQQGNIVTRDMVEQLRPGMTRDQVRFLLGTPMLTDVFHQDRWDYPYALRRRSGETQIRKLYVVFAEGKLARFQSDTMPTEPLADSLILGSKPRPAAAPAATPPAPAAPAPDPAPAQPSTPAAPATPAVPATPPAQ
jgi:outer membrane protein assembly factor BamE